MYTWLKSCGAARKPCEKQRKQNLFFHIEIIQYSQLKQCGRESISQPIKNQLHIIPNNRIDHKFANNFGKIILSTIIVLTMLTVNGEAAMTEQEKKLVDLATIEFGKLTDAEVKFFSAVARSHPSHYTEGGDSDPANANK